MTGYYLYIFLLLWGFTHLTTGNSEEVENEKEKVDNIYPSMAPNSKFLNPRVDDATNLQLAIAAFEKQPEENQNNQSKTAEALSKLSQTLAASSSGEPLKNSRVSKSLRGSRIFPFLQSVITGNKNLKHKNL